MRWRGGGCGFNIKKSNELRNVRFEGVAGAQGAKVSAGLSVVDPLSLN